MDFGTLLQTAKQNDHGSKKDVRYYSTKFSAPKKEKKDKALSANIQKFLARKEAEEQQKAHAASRKKEELLALRSMDRKAQRRVNVMLKRTKSANQAIIEDAVDKDNTAVTLAGPSQPDEDDYGYVSQEAAAFYNKMMEKYTKMPDDPKFPTSKKKASSNLLSTKDRVRAALEREKEEAMLPHRRKRKHKEGEQVTEYEEREPDEQHDEPPAKARPKASAPPPMNFMDLLKLAEQKQHEPIMIEVKPKEEEGPLLTKKQKREIEQQQQRKVVPKETNKTVPEKASAPQTNRIPKVVPVQPNRSEYTKVSNLESHKESSKSTGSNNRMRNNERTAKSDGYNAPVMKSKSFGGAPANSKVANGQISSSREPTPIKTNSRDSQSSKNSDKNAYVIKTAQKPVSKPESTTPVKTSLNSLGKNVPPNNATRKIPDNRPSLSKNSEKRPLNLKPAVESSSKSTGKSTENFRRDLKPNGNLKAIDKPRPASTKPREFPPKDVQPKRFPPDDLRPKQFPPKDLKPKQFPPSDMRPKQFPPPDVRPRKFPPNDIRRKPMVNKRRILDDDEYDSEMDDFIDDGPEDQEDYSSYIKDIFGYDRSKYRGMDDDVDNMESTFAQQMREDVRSTKIGIMEDLEDIKREKEEKRQKAVMKKRRQL